MNKILHYFASQNGLSYSWKDGLWSDAQTSSNQTIKVHMAATALHYGQSAIEGLRLIKGFDNQLRAFCPQWHCDSLKNSSERVFMPVIDEDFFMTIVQDFVSANTPLVSALAEGDSIYLRFVLFGNGPRIGIQPSDEYALAVSAGDVSPLLGADLNCLLYTDLDRSPLYGTGPTTLSGNYTPGLKPAFEAAQQGFEMSLFSDSKENLFVDSSVDAPLMALAGDTLILAQCPSSPRSSTGDALEVLARQQGFVIKEENLQIAALGTMDELATVANMNGVHCIKKLQVKGGESFTYEPAVTFPKLAKSLLAIQQGTEEDSENWCTTLAY
jgi:branched-chain amino acid aminotransferase